jgi:uncharacterized repeat protein (TIGR03803 family)
VRQLETRLTPSLSTLAAFVPMGGAHPHAGLIMDSSGNLYGTTTQGGASGDGSVFELDRGSGKITTLASFNGTDGANPYAGLIMDSSGSLYGTTLSGGAFGSGTVFELAHGSGKITTLASFNGTDGAGPDGALIMDSTGTLYGTASSGGASAQGAVFALAPRSGKITTLASFNGGTDGANPECALIMDSSGNLYGTTVNAGASAGGTVFELAQSSGKITTLASFNSTGGGFPLAGLIMDSRGNLYGTTGYGGASGEGTVFELAQGSGTITRLASFNGTDGATPDGALIMDNSGNLYSTASGGGADKRGTVFELVHGSGTITRLASFKFGDGRGPYGGLVMDSRGNLYGTTYRGGASNAGTVFELAHGSDTITTLASCIPPPRGAHPEGGLVMDSSGNLFGTTRFGGTHNDGTVFEVAAGTGTITILASFNGANGYEPVAELVMDSSGNLYGTTLSGGASGLGSVFELAAGSRSITTLASFDGSDGANPYAALIIDGRGNLYGTTYRGGAFGLGAVFELAQGSGTISTLASFGGADGKAPQGSLIVDGSGNLYGTASKGGAFGDGTLFEVAAGSGTITRLASFNGTDGANPQAGLVMDSSGNLYGTASHGGTFGDGTVFELAKGSHTITTLVSFDGTDGANPYGGLVMDGSGNLYGTTVNGGGFGDGTVFQVVPATARLNTLAEFNATNGSHPYGTLTVDSSGNLYGTTYDGGTPGLGTVFELSGSAAPTG